MPEAIQSTAQSVNGAGWSTNPTKTAPNSIGSARQSFDVRRASVNFFVGAINCHRPVEI